MRWFVTLLLGAAGGYLAARATMRSELDQFRREMEAGGGRSVTAPAPAPAAPPPPAPEPAGTAAEVPVPEAPGVTPETVMLIAASVAAFLGKHAVVRRIRVAGHRSGDPWALYGRTTVQASHNIVHAR